MQPRPHPREEPATGEGGPARASDQRKDDIAVEQTTRPYDQKTLIPGILVPDEERSALAG
jgi:hypothetical protein